MNASEPNWKDHTRKQWNSTPCGNSNGEEGTLGYFLDLEHDRYEVDAPWMRSVIGFDRHQGQRLLELGFGQGTDLCQFAQGGAICSGVDITQRHFELASENARLRRLEADLFLEDASKLHFDDACFDTVYSFGVLHHTPDIERCLSEAHRVLRPDGELILALYHRYSAFYWIPILLIKGVVRGKFWKLGYRGLVSTIEDGADGIQIKPLVNLYSKQQLKGMLANFSQVEISIHHLKKSHFSWFRRVVPQFVVDFLEPYLGWYVIARAKK